MRELEEEVQDLFPKFAKLTREVGVRSRDGPANTKVTTRRPVTYALNPDGYIEKAVIVIPCPTESDTDSLSVAYFESTGTTQIDPNTPSTFYTLNRDGSVICDGQNVTGYKAQEVVELVTKAVEREYKLMERNSESYIAVPSTPPIEEPPYGPSVLTPVGGVVLIAIAISLIARRFAKYR